MNLYHFLHLAVFLISQWLIAESLKTPEDLTSDLQVLTELRNKNTWIHAIGVTMQLKNSARLETK